MRLSLLAGLTTCLLLSACGPSRSPYYDTITILSAGEVTNGLPDFGLRSIVLRGNFGIVWVGTNPVAITTNGLTGWSADGPAQPPKRDARAATGWITFFEPDRAYDLADADAATVARTLEWKREAPGRMEAVRITGAFSRLVSEQYGEEADRRGMLMGFYVPPYLRGLQRTPYRWWFLDAARQVLLTANDFTVREARVEVDESNDLQVRLPPTLP